MQALDPGHAHQWQPWLPLVRVDSLEIWSGVASGSTISTGTPAENAISSGRTLQCFHSYVLAACVSTRLVTMPPPYVRQ